MKLKSDFENHENGWMMSGIFNLMRGRELDTDFGCWVF